MLAVGVGLAVVEEAGVGDKVGVVDGEVEVLETAMVWDACRLVKV